MSINSRLKQAISSFIGGRIEPGYSSESKTSELYVRYILEILLTAANNEGASISYQDANGNEAKSYLFRRSPGQIYTKTEPFTHLVLEFPGKPLLEVHVGIMVRGVSEIAHECDIAVLNREEANRCREIRCEPDFSQVLIAIECKHYESELDLDLARSFIGLAAELQVEADCYFVSNSFSVSVGKLLATRGLIWELNIAPGNTNNINRLRYSFQRNFKDFKAKY